MTSYALAAVMVTACTKPESVSAPMGAFMSWRHWLPLLVWCISGSRVPVLFLVELGAAISVELTTVTCLSRRPLAVRVALTVAKIYKLRSCALI